MNEHDARLILQVDETANLEDVKVAYKAQIMLAHPDRAAGESPAVQAAATTRTQQLGLAKETLERILKARSRASGAGSHRAGSHTSTPRNPPRADQPPKIQILHCSRCGTPNSAVHGKPLTCSGCGRQASVQACSSCDQNNRVWGKGRWRCAGCASVQGEQVTEMSCRKCGGRQDVPDEEAIYACTDCRAPLFRVTCSRCQRPADVWGLGNWNCASCRGLNIQKGIRIAAF